MSNKSQASRTGKATPAQRTRSVKAPTLNASIPEGLLIALFCAFIIMVVRMRVYERPMEQFFWSSGSTQSADFFSFYKMVLVLLCGVLAVLFLGIRLLRRNLVIHQSFVYWPMAVYAVLVLLSFLTSSYKEFSLLGYNDRFEGTLPILCYMILLFFVMNRINTEADLSRWIIVPLLISSFLLCLIGISQGTGHDFFQSVFGKQLITPTWFWPNIDGLNFTFQNNEIYQTVYNINYVSFYLTLLLPLVGLLFIREQRKVQKASFAVLFAILLYNLIGSESSGGFLGLAVVVTVAFIVLNKRLLSWWKSILILLVITLLVGGISYDRWYPELSGAIRSSAATSSAVSVPSDSSTPTEPASIRPTIDYFETDQNKLSLSINGNPLTIAVNTLPSGIFEGYSLTDDAGKEVALLPSQDPGLYYLDDDRFYAYLSLAYASDGTNYYMVLNTERQQWPFALQDGNLHYRNDLGNYVSLHRVPAYGFEHRQNFGSGRGYIWSRTLPMLKETLLLGHGADTYCIYFPQDDYAGKYNAKWTPTIIVDKPHNMYLGAAVGTGVLSVLALFFLYGAYLVQSFRLYFRMDFEKNRLAFAGAGIFFGICGFLVTGFVDDSSVSLMPMFYSLLGAGFAVNRMLFGSVTGGQK